ncbi:hypothetical protein SCWH03_22170 [Streptomyces pacificus]|uniref:Uncharacterized protein n=1 Tax=Streptomyces pacificus TaxID=2705029 RepID=A0A6A0AU63_9ACTN|nr:hypothetical protein SCWH03_22170 [Streptomyces pacificus]
MTAGAAGAHFRRSRRIRALPPTTRARPYASKTQGNHTGRTGELVTAGRTGQWGTAVRRGGVALGTVALVVPLGLALGAAPARAASCTASTGPYQPAGHLRPVVSAAL